MAMVGPRTDARARLPARVPTRRVARQYRQDTLGYIIIYRPTVSVIIYNDLR